jgi:hypothetical protein
MRSGSSRFAEQTLVAHVNSVIETAELTEVETRFVGQWEWCVTLRRANSRPSVYLECGPTAVVENERASVTLVDPDYTEVFVPRQASEHDGIDHISQTDVGLGEVPRHV